MSESVSTAGGVQSGGAPQGPSAPAPAAQPQTSASQGTGGQSQQGQAEPSKGFQANAQGADTAQPAPAAEEFEEIALGSTKGKVPKAVAKAIKEFERGMQAKMREAAEQRKQFEHTMNLMKSNPDEYAKLTGIDLDSFAEERLAKKYELQQMNEDQRRAYEAEQKLAEMKKMDLQSKRQLLDELRDLTGESVDDETAAVIPKDQIARYLQGKREEYKQAETAFESEFINAWKETGLPQAPIFGQWVAAMMHNHQKMVNAGKIQSGPLQAKEAAAKVKAKFTTSVRGMFLQMAPDAIQEFLGKDVVQKLRDFDVERVNRQNDPLINSKEKSPGSPPASEPKKQLNQLEWRKAMGLS